MATFYYCRSDTGERVGVSGHGKQHAKAKAAVKLGLKADQLHLLEESGREGSAKPHRRPGTKSKEERRKRAPIPSRWHGEPSWRW